MKKIIAIGLFVLLGLIILVAGFGGKTSPVLGGASYKPVFQASGTTNTNITLGTAVKTVVPAGYVNIAIITTGSVVLSCSLDNLTAASSSAAANIGIILPVNSKTSFGPLGDYPFLGAINCVATASTTVGVVTN